MPRLSCTFAEFLEIIEANGFVLHRHDGGSHRRYRGEVGGRVRYVDLAPHRWGDEIRLKTLESMIRQTGLPKALFRK